MWFLTKAAVGPRQIGWTTAPDCVYQVWDGVSGHRTDSPASQTESQGPCDKVLPNQKGKMCPVQSGVCGVLGGVAGPDLGSWKASL